jgi:hypothetical protein
LWNLFEKSDIYKFLTGETNTIPEFRHNYIACSAKTKITFNLQGFANDLAHSNIQLSAQQQPVQRAHSAPMQVQHFLSKRKNTVNYRPLDLGQELQQATND